MNIRQVTCASMVHPLKCGVIAWRGIVRQGWFLRDPDQGNVNRSYWMCEAVTI